MPATRKYRIYLCSPRNLVKAKSFGQPQCVTLRNSVLHCEFATTHLILNKQHARSSAFLALYHLVSNHMQIADLFMSHNY